MASSTGERDAAAAAGTDPTRGRWWIVGAAILVQLALGAVYSWSVFNGPLQEQFGWTKAEVVLPFTVVIGTIFIGSLVGGRIQDRRGPRPVALVGGVIYSLGVMGASLVGSADQLWLLVLTYGIMGGIGLGAVYITPIAMLNKWFPDKRGLITGLAVGGFGFGAVLTSPVAQRLLAGTDDKTSVFLPLGIAYLVMVLVGAAFFRNPPAGYVVPGYTPATTGRSVASTREYTLGEALRTPQWYLLTAVLTLNVLAGIALISQASDAIQDIAGATPAAAAVFVGVMGLFNGAGRIFWAALSDKIGRMTAFVGMLGLQAICFLLLPQASVYVLFFVLGAIVYLCYGGGFGTMPATAADFFGTKNVGGIYGAMIVAWSLGGVVGPLLAAVLYQASGQSYTVPFLTIAVIAAVSIALPILTKPPKSSPTEAGEDLTAR